MVDSKGVAVWRGGGGGVDSKAVAVWGGVIVKLMGCCMGG